MSLDIMAVAGQVRQMGEDIASAQSDFRDCVRQARRMMKDNSSYYKSISRGIVETREERTARAALPMEPLAAHHEAPACPATYVAAAADGSQAEPDRHGHVSYYLVNTGSALIRYGAGPDAAFVSVPRLYYRAEDMVVTEPRQENWPATREPREAPIDSEILAMKRSLAEIEDLARLAENIPADLPSVLMIDGTLTLFSKVSGDNIWVSELFTNQYRAALDTIKNMGLPVVGFVSRSNASWVMDMLQVGVCQRKVEACAFCRRRPHDPGKETAGCALAGLRDRFLYDQTVDEPDVLPPLRPGERSALFQQSASLYKDYGDNEPAMFYLNSGREIAQVQVPMWAAKNDAMLARVHALVYAQCVNGGGYPTVLTRAHEQAVVTAADRETLDALVLAQLTKRGIVVPLSEKARSKQMRGI